MALNLNVSPYFDDFDEDKKFHQVLYNPSIAVQARELTQQQSITKNQIEKFSNFVFQDGSKVTGGDLSLNVDFFNFVKLEVDFPVVAGSPITISDFLGVTLYGETSNAIAVVIHTEDATATDIQPTLYVKYLTGASDTTAAVFADGERIGDNATFASSTLKAQLITPTATGLGSGVQIEEGFFYVNGVYAKILQQTIVLDKYTNTPSYKVGLKVVESVITSGADVSLLDPASGSTNANAPGADRLKVELTLIKKALDSIDDEDFVEILRVENGVKKKDIRVPLLSDLEETFARRTYDESGSYTVKPFRIQLDDDPLDETKLIATLDPGKAFVFGHEHETISPTTISIDKARSTEQVTGFDINMKYGNFLVVKDIKGMVDISTNETIDLHTCQYNGAQVDAGTLNGATTSGTGTFTDAGAEWITVDGVKRGDILDISTASAEQGRYIILSVESDTSMTVSPNFGSSVSSQTFTIENSISTVDNAEYTASKIGTARVRQFTYVSGTGGGTDMVYNLFLYDVQMTNLSMDDVESVYVGDETNTNPFKADIDDSSKAGGVATGDTQLQETDFNSLIFATPQTTLNTIRDAGSAVKTQYTYKKSYINESVTTGQAQIGLSGNKTWFGGAGTLSNTLARTNYTVTINTVGNSGLNIGDEVFLDVSGTDGARNVALSGGNQTLTIELQEDAWTGVTVDIIGTINTDQKQERLKTLVRSVEFDSNAGSDPNTTALGFDSLAKSDGFALHAIYDSGTLGVAAVTPVVTTTGAGPLTVGEVITGGTSGATGIVVSEVTTTLKVVMTSGTFVDTETITGTESTNTVVVSGAPTSGDTDISSRYTFDNGMRDNFYDHARIQLKAGQTGPTGEILVIYDHFTHSGSGYLSVDSYSTPVTYALIPKYTSPTTGDIIELRDVIDFRPRRDDGATSISGNELGLVNTNWSADYSFFLARIDNVFLDMQRNFGVNVGIPSLSFSPPPSKKGTMELYNLFIPPYTFDPSEVHVLYIENKRYTMRDIGAFEQRLDNLEYYASLSLLEKDTQNLVLKDGNGLTRFKNGILVDNFAGHSVGNVFSEDYKCSIDFDEHQLRPPFVSNIVDIDYQSGDSTGITQTGDLLTLPFTETTFVDQPVASTFTNVNPFDIVAWIGAITLDPPSDNWIDQTTRPDINVNIGGANDGWDQLVGLGFGSQFGDWQHGWTGREKLIHTSARWLERAGRGWPIRWNTTETYQQTNGQIRKGIQKTIVGTDIIKNSVGERVADVAIVPFIRSRTINFSVTGMKPKTEVFAFFDGKDVSSHVNGGSPMYTDDSGSLASTAFIIPNNDTLRFRTGERQFLLTDTSNGSLITAGTYAEIMYQAQGLLQTKENVIVSTRVPRIHTGAMGSATETRTNTSTFKRINHGGWYDPIAQTFLVDPLIYPDGIFVTSLDVFFKSKDTDNLPVSVHIRDTTNGYPSSTVVPFTDVSLLPASVNTSADSNTGTTFTFPSPAYLQPGEYAMVVMSNSNKYETWISEMNQNIVGTNRKVSKQPYAGVLFKSQNASTWTPDQNQDLKFLLRQATFTISGTHDAIFKDESGTPIAQVKMDQMQVYPEQLIMNSTGIDWSVKTTAVGGSLGSTYSNITANTNQKFTTQQEFNTGLGTFDGKATFSSSNVFVSPVIDTKRTSVIAVENLINNLSTNETNSSGGDSIARYITRRVNLADSFDATDLKVIATVTKEGGTNIIVYYKILASTDSETFEEKPWTQMSQTTSSGVTSLDDLDEIEFEWEPTTSPITYVANGATFTSFKTFAIKIVMTSTNTSVVPTVKELRAIAIA